MKISEQQLLQYNAQGLVPGPGEDENTFIQRAEYCLNLKERIEGELPFEAGAAGEAEILEQAFPLTEKCYGIAPRWLPLYFSNVKLMPWHGATAWIFQMTEQEPTGALLQLRKAFHRQQRFLGLYSRQEVIAHEISHVGRMAFEEPAFEEILACRSSSSRWRRAVGGIVQSGKESALIVFFLMLSLLVDLFILTFGPLEAFVSAMWLKALPLALIGWGAVRLWRRQRQLKRCLQRLSGHLRSEEQAAAFAYRLTDLEIVEIAALSDGEVSAYLSKRCGGELRWKLLEAAYTAPVSKIR